MGNTAAVARRRPGNGYGLREGKQMKNGENGIPYRENLEDRFTGASVYASFNYRQTAGRILDTMISRRQKSPPAGWRAGGLYCDTAFI